MSRPTQAFELAEKYFGGLAAGPAVDRVARRRAADGEREPGDGRSRRAAAAVYQLAFAGDVRARRCGARHRGRRARARQDVAALQDARLRAPRRDRRVGVSALARNGRHVPDRLHRRGRRRAAGAEQPRSSPRWRAGRGGPTAAEIERGVAQTEAQFIYRLQTIGGFGGKGDQLNAYNTFVGDPGYFERDRQRYFDVTSNGAAAAVSRWLVKAPSVSLSVVPQRPPRAGAAGRGRGAAYRDRRSQPAAGSRSGSPVSLSRASSGASLPNGLELRAVPHRSVPVVVDGAARARRIGGRSGRRSRAGVDHRRAARRRQPRPVGARHRRSRRAHRRRARHRSRHGCRGGRPDDARSVLSRPAWRWSTRS